MSKRILPKWKSERDKMRERFDSIETPPPVCKKFGCGKLLTPTEFLYGEYCFRCTQLRIINKQNLPGNETI
jgi:hypothetical protein